MTCLSRSLINSSSSQLNPSNSNSNSSKGTKTWHRSSKTSNVKRAFLTRNSKSWSKN